METTTELTKEYIETRIGSMISDKAFDVLKGRYEDLGLSIEVFGDYCYMLTRDLSSCSKVKRYQK